ncbi:hypothetical protein AURANDRAFT_62775 [Aureococcus anophagefferens]|uniref:Thioredoxin domain-containing protein n=1 Tax=Aureococcus anophagefferens TaxID=44056 RepID=F0Y308_AURAN|nr:hypothetical protein AURANDRAFT_62775 [Aureococcus anophagefferens]EGB10331.1 hypothetical protein AURANDRAFT_62775 [Aureococcus anophagefferens]|eukprot:XP_009035137.1 hypothetical protein AURANDRAFT_62775 [Aureococcus anophagefferens]
MLRRFLLGAAALGLARCEELEFEDEEVVEKRPFPKTFEDMIWMAPPANVTMLTLETFDELTANKTCFINFCASWLTACKVLDPNWGSLYKEFAGDDDKLIAQVDCQHDGASLCEKYQVESLPTLMFGAADELQVYEDGRSWDSLKGFVTYRMKKQCSPAHKEYCSTEQEINLARYVTMDEEELEIATEKIEEKMHNIGADYGGKMWTLQNQYDTAIRVKEKHIRGMMGGSPCRIQPLVRAVLTELRNSRARSNRSGSYGTMMAVKAFRAKNGEDMTGPATAAVDVDGSTAAV